MDESLNQRTLHEIWHQLQRVDWTDLQLEALVLSFWMVLALSSWAIRKLVTRKRHLFVLRQINAWNEALSQPFSSMTLDAQLAALSKLRDLEGHPRVVVAYLVKIRVSMEMIGIHERILAAVDEIAEERLTRAKK